MKQLVVIALLLLSSLCFGQKPASQNLTSPFPHPYIETSIGLNGGGYSPISSDNIGGIGIETKHLISTTEAEYDFVKKSNDGGPINTKGRERTLSSQVFYKLNNGLLLGGEYSWTDLSTTNYFKTNSRWEVGGGVDLISNENQYSGRIISQYFQEFHSHSDNGGKGIVFQVILPSPATNGWKLGPVNLFYDERLEVLNFHNVGQTDRQFTGFITFGILARF